MTKKIDLKTLNNAELVKERTEKQEALRKMRFNVSGKAKNHGAKELRQEVARINTEIRAREMK
jgi:ribosomal protein L29